MIVFKTFCLDSFMIFPFSPDSGTVLKANFVYHLLDLQIDGIKLILLHELQVIQPIFSLLFSLLVGTAIKETLVGGRIAIPDCTCVRNCIFFIKSGGCFEPIRFFNVDQH